MYEVYQWACGQSMALDVNAAPGPGNASVDPNSCVPVTTISRYHDGSMYSSMCGCCSGEFENKIIVSNFDLNLNLNRSLQRARLCVHVRRRHFWHGSNLVPAVICRLLGAHFIKSSLDANVLAQRTRWPRMPAICSTWCH